MPPLTAKDVTISLYWAMRGASQLLIPRYTPHKWWGYWTHEAKSKEGMEPSQEPITDLDVELPPAAKV